MIIHLHASCWNEARILPFFFRYYDGFIDDYYMHDNESDDGSLAILAAHPRVTVLPLVLEGESCAEAAFAQVNEFWWPSRRQADWVAVCNVDEFFWHQDMRRYLEHCRALRVTYLLATGYQMVADRFPRPGDNLPESIRHGARFTNYGQARLFQS